MQQTENGYLRDYAETENTRKTRLCSKMEQEK
jgi:hypothetical protein